MRLAACGYLASMGGESPREFFVEFLGSNDNQTRLEAVIVLGEAPEAVEVLAELLDDVSLPYFLR